MAPEQLADGKITPAADVYACGVVADEILPDGRPPELTEIVERCLRPEPADRFTDAHALGEALADVEGNGRVGTVRRVNSTGARTKVLPPTGGRTASWPAPTTRRVGLRSSARVLATLAVVAIATVALVAA